MRRRLPLFTAAAALLAWPEAAQAHLVTTGLGPVYDGIGHLLSSFDDLLPVVALAALAGLNGAATGRRALFLLPAAWLAAGGVAHAARIAPLPAWIAAATLLISGVLVAADRRLSPRIVSAIALVVGAAHGASNGAGIAAGGRGAGGLLGIAGMVFILGALVAAFVVSLRDPRARIAVRAAGSWIAATGFLYLGWILRGRG